MKSVSTLLFVDCDMDIVDIILYKRGNNCCHIMCLVCCSKCSVYSVLSFTVLGMYFVECYFSVYYYNYTPH